MTLNTALSHFRAMCLVEESKVHYQSAYVPREAVQLPKCPKCNAGCSISLLRVQKRVEISQWLWLPPTPSKKVDSGVGLLSWLPLIHLYSKLYIIIIIISLLFWWLRHCWTSNFFSSVNTNLGTVPSFMRSRMCWHLSSLLRSWVVESSCLFCIL